MTGGREAVGRVDAGADRRAAQRQLAHAGEHRLEPLDGVAHRGGVAGELLAEHHRRRVHQVGAARLHQPGELLRLRARARSPGRRGRAAGRRSPRAQAATWMAVGKVSLDDCEALTWSLGCTSTPARVASVAITSLAFMLELVPEPVWKTSIGNASSWSPRRHLAGRRLDGGRRLRVEDAESAVDLRRRGLHLADGVDQRRLDRRAADREVLDRALGLGPPQRVARHLDLAHRVVLGAELLLTHASNVPSKTRCRSAPRSVRLVAWPTTSRASPALAAVRPARDLRPAGHAAAPRRRLPRGAGGRARGDPRARLHAVLLPVDRRDRAPTRSGSSCSTTGAARAELTPERWQLDLGVWHDGRFVGVQGVSTHDFPVTRTGETGSWLGQEFHGRGLGTLMRQAICVLCFDHLGFEEVTSAAFADNPASQGVSRKVGYRPTASSATPARARPRPMRAAGAASRRPGPAALRRGGRGRGGLRRLVQARAT